MTRVLTMIVMGVLMLADAPAIAGDAISQSTVSKRQTMAQVAHCMRKRMSADKDISYNAAAKVCKNQVNNQGNNSASVTVMASDSAPKP
jgi:hypothetical protein